MITYQLVTEQKHFQQVSNLEKTIWEADDLDVISPHVLRVAWHTGGCIIAAFDGKVIIGIAIAFAMKGEPRLWSHIAAVHPDYQRQGIGYNLKYQQREWALANGYTQMSWTFDPMMAANAHFNFHLLGTISQTYHVNFYGEMQDGLNAGVPSDRFEVVWLLQAETTPTHQTPESASFLLKVDNDRPQVVSELLEEWHFVEIPANFSTLRKTNQSLAIEWKKTLRHIIQPAFEQGYRVVDFVRCDGRNWYALTRENNVES